MTMRVIAGDNAEIIKGGTWVLHATVTDVNGTLADDEPAVTIELPDGADTDASVSADSLGNYTVTYVTSMAGRHVARLVADTDTVAASAYVTDIVTASGVPTVADLDNYLGTHSHTDEDLAEALEAETDAQRRVCRIPATFPNDLRSALLRRAQFHLAMKRVQLGVIPGDADRDTLRPGFDSEVRRFEKPYRKLPVG
jgi:hypothetical protein